MRTIRIEAPIAEMKFDLPGFTVEAGEEIEIEFFNPDQMPHNLVVTVPGALESVGAESRGHGQGAGRVRPGTSSR